MKNVTQRVTTVLLHIPKTAGTTLKTIILRHFAPWHVFRFYPEGDHKSRLKRLHEHIGRGRQVRLVLGHLGYGIHQDLETPVRYLTVLREPVSRVVSHYYHVRDHADHPLHTEVRRMELEDYLDSGIDEAATNSQTRFLSTDKWNEEMGRRRAAGADLLAEAKEHLDRIAVVGISGRLDETLMLLRAVMGWFDVHYASLNIGRSKRRAPPIAARVREKIVERNQLDAALYAEAVTRFEEQVARVVNYRELERFRRGNKIIGPLIGYPSRVLQRLTVGL